MRLASSKVYLIVGTITLLALIGAFVLGLLSANKMREIISDQFNQQQLVIARGVAEDVEDKFRFLIKELHTLNLSPAIQYLEVSWPNRMAITLENAKDFGVQEIGLITIDEKRIYTLQPDGRSLIKAGEVRNPELLAWARQPERLDQVFIQQVTADLRPADQEFCLLLLALPTYQVSVDESHPVATRQFVGTLYFLINPTDFVRRFVYHIRSGQTGYAWVIDGSGYFLYHPEKEFVGQNAFEIREKRTHAISFSEINKIQRERMLTGQEGTSWYWSGWHRGLEQKMKKFIAFAPIRLQAANAAIIWSVAVVAPPGGGGRCHSMRFISGNFSCRA